MSEFLSQDEIMSIIKGVNGEPLEATEHFQVFATVNTPVGIFTGFASDFFTTHEEAYAELSSIQEMLRNCDSFTFFSNVNLGAEFTIGRTAIDNSVFEMIIVTNDKK